MNPNETRQIWLITKDTIPQCCAWALVKTYAEAPAGKESWASALGANELVADGWDATPTQWRRVPQMVRPGAVEHGSPMVSGRNVVVAGLSYDMDSPGRAHPQHTESSAREPQVPDAVVNDEDALLAASEAMDTDIRFVEKSTLKNWRASPAGDAVRGGEDVMIHRVTGTKTRTNK